MTSQIRCQVRYLGSLVFLSLQTEDSQSREEREAQLQEEISRLREANRKLYQFASDVISAGPSNKDT